MVMAMEAWARFSTAAPIFIHISDSHMQASEVPVFLVTHFPKSAGAEFATVVLQCGCNESPLQSGSVAAKVGQLFLIDCMFYGFCCHKPETRSAARSATAHAIANKLL